MRATLGCFFTVVYFLLVGFLTLASMMGDCFEGLGHSCPTDAQRNLHTPLVFVCGVAIYLVIGLAVSWLSKRRTNDPD